MHYEPTECYPKGKPQIGRWLEPAPDVGTATTYKILKDNGWMIHKETVRAWAPKEIANPALQKNQDDFMAAIHSHMGRAAKPADFPEADLTPDFSYYTADDENVLLVTQMKLRI